MKPDTPAANDPTMDLQQAADFLHLGFKAMKALVESGEVPAVSLNQKHTVLLREDLIAYVREEGRKQAEQRKRRTGRTSGGAGTTRRRPRGALPNLDAYELTTAAAPASSPAGSHTAAASPGSCVR